MSCVMAREYPILNGIEIILLIKFKKPKIKKEETFSSSEKLF